MIELNRRIGGPVGRHAVREGRWFNPVLWAIVLTAITWLIVTVRQLPCRPNADNPFPNPYLRTCYTDITALYFARDFWTGNPLYSVVSLEYPVLIAAMIVLARALIALLGYHVSPEIEFDDRLAASEAFFQVTSIMLFVLFAGLVLCHIEMAYDRDRRRYSPRVWDVLFIAAAPVVMLNGLINWDMLPLFLTSMALLAWHRRRPFPAGILLGLGFAAKMYPLIALIGLTLLCLRAWKPGAMWRVWAGAIVAWLVVNLPVMITAWDGWKEFWVMNAGREADLGSIWYALKLAGITIPAVNVISYLLMIICGLAITVLVFSAPRRPRIGQVCLLLLVAFVGLTTVYSPQYCLWLLPFIVLARPKLHTVAIWTAGEAIYFFAIWGHLEGILATSSAQWLYCMAIVVRLMAQMFVVGEVVDDILHPWDDPVRLAHVDDPIGGILDHASDHPLIASIIQARTQARIQAPGDTDAPQREEAPQHADEDAPQHADEDAEEPPSDEHHAPKRGIVEPSPS